MRGVDVAVVGKQGCLCQHQRGVFVKGEGLAVDCRRIIDVVDRESEVLGC